MNFELKAELTASQKLSRVAALCAELQDEDNEAIVESRIEGLAKELKVAPFQCALMYWALKEQSAFRTMFGKDVKVRFRAR